MNVVTLNQRNLQLLDHVAEGVFDHPLDPAQVEAFLGCPRHIMVLAMDDDIVVGMASAVEYFHPDKLPQLWINEVGVTPSRQNRGIGRRLIGELLEIARKRGCSNAWIGTERSNIPAQRCYQAVPAGEVVQEFLLYEWQIAGNQPTDEVNRPSDADDDE